MRVPLPLRVTALLAAAALSVMGCSTAQNAHGAADTTPASSHMPSSPGQPSSVRTPTSVSEPSLAVPTGRSPPSRPVHVSLLEADGGVYGVGMPIIAWFTRAPGDPAAFEKAVAVTVNGAPAGGAWYWEKSAHRGAAVEAHYRPQHYWPAHAKIRMNAPVKGLSAGKGLAYDDSLTLSMSTGAANIATVDGHSERMTVTSDGKKVFSFPVSLGAADHPTYGGTKIAMEKNRVQEMKSSPGGPYYDLKVPWSVRLTIRASSSTPPRGTAEISASAAPATAAPTSTSPPPGSTSSSPRSVTYSPTPTRAARRCHPGTATATGTCRGRRGRPVGFCDRYKTGDS